MRALPMTAADSPPAGTNTVSPPAGNAIAGAEA